MGLNKGQAVVLNSQGRFFFSQLSIQYYGREQPLPNELFVIQGKLKTDAVSTVTSTTGSPDSMTEPVGSKSCLEKWGRRECGNSAGLLMG